MNTVYPNWLFSFYIGIILLERYWLSEVCLEESDLEGSVLHCEEKQKNTEALAVVG